MSRMRTICLVGVVCLAAVAGACPVRPIPSSPLKKAPPPWHGRLAHVYHGHLARGIVRKTATPTAGTAVGHTGKMPVPLFQRTASLRSAPVSTSTHYRYAPPPAESDVHDGRGNRLSNGLFLYEWDDKDRLTAVQVVDAIRTDASVPAHMKVRLAFLYDHQGRRLRKEVFHWDAQAAQWVSQSARRFVYDGWLLLAELSDEGQLLRSYAWGPDVSHEEAGAGGVGGLLAVRDHLDERTYWPVSDANGNVVALVDAADQSVAATYEYTPFGQLLHVDGPAAAWSNPAAANPFLFSTKYFDAEIGLYYYGYRYYDPRNGKWLSRDPLAEEGGLNLYGFCRNNPIDSFDPLGLEGEFLPRLWKYGLGHWLFSGAFQDDLRDLWTKDDSSLIIFKRNADVVMASNIDAASKAVKYAGGRIMSGDTVGLVNDIGWQFRNDMTNMGTDAWGTAKRYANDPRKAASDDAVRIRLVVENGVAQLRAEPWGTGGRLFGAYGPPLVFTRGISAAGGVTSSLATVYQLPKGSPLLGWYANAERIWTPPASLQGPRTASYGDLSKELAGTGAQANHLNQNAAFGSIIPKKEGISVAMKGNAFADVGFPHFNFHSFLEEFWSKYRKGGELFGTVPTNAEYGAALKQALLKAGHTPAEAACLAEQAGIQRAVYGCLESMPVPSVPKRLPQRK
ncbi:MAG: tRNA3(Ser)-specific nuclease WapA precursor [Planctomycetes bacterium ADurb.Bin126]|nr:MAG: tRNA3(Ser)-specific nuclease WapA precursor [Planctomycetes bacterium ADurb.Bin126]HQL76006.1 RHS repeat-associated core domain-containing protein [Phycisphaerae bacterium]